MQKRDKKHIYFKDTYIKLGGLITISCILFASLLYSQREPEEKISEKNSQYTEIHHSAYTK